MPRRATPLNPDGGPQARFALALRRLRDEAGFNAKTIDVIAAENHMPRSTLYAALRGTRIPTVPVLAALVRAWGGDPTEWLIRRTETEDDIERLRLQAALPAAVTRRGGAEAVNSILQQHGDLSIQDIREPGPEDFEIALWTHENALPELRRRWRDDDPFFWEELRRIAGVPTIRTIARHTGVPQGHVAVILRGGGKDPISVEKVHKYLDAKADALAPLDGLGES
ncbi:helix-turn-helix domain-containing protein [Streptomyces sp. NPDC057456]|uniref:helix-turn-helix domain-containing protein n=1 Tax=Streptomyces sp. NPDC057456 TaxID=3346139 RepID=UPI0036C74C6A